MGKAQPLPILITGGGRRIGLALAWHFINQKQPVIVSYRTHYPAIDGLIKAGAQCIQADFSTNDGVMAFADEVLKSTHGLRAILHNASAWMAEKPGTPLADVLACMMQIHVNTPYCSTMRWKDYCVGTDTPPAISFTLPIMWWSAVATNMLRMLQAKRHWII